MVEIETHITPGERLRTLRKRRGYDTASQLAQRVGFATATVVHHENGTRNITAEGARAYAQALNVKPELILYGKDFNQVEENAGISLTRKVALLRVPLLSSTDIEQFIAIIGGSRPMSERQIFAPIPLPDGNRIFSVQMPDDSMAGEGKDAIYPGEPVYIDPDLKPDRGSLVAVTLKGYDEMVIRKYRRSSLLEDGTEAFDLVAINPDYGTEKDVHTREHQIVGRVVGFYRAF
jgi:SOS-response transcriptional repressor LexA